MDRVTEICISLAAYGFLYAFIMSKRGKRIAWSLKTVLFALPLYSLLFIEYLATGWFKTSAGLATFVALTCLLTAVTLAVALVGERHGGTSRKLHGRPKCSPGR